MVDAQFRRKLGARLKNAKLKPPKQAKTESDEYADVQTIATVLLMSVGNQCRKCFFFAVAASQSDPTCVTRANERVAEASNCHHFTEMLQGSSKISCVTVLCKTWQFGMAPLRNGGVLEIRAVECS